MAYLKYKENSQPPKKETISLEGKIICLPHKDTDGPQTLECAAGLQTADGKNYGLSTNDPASPLTTAAGSDKKAFITGELEPARDTIYAIEGVVVVERYEFKQ